MSNFKPLEARKVYNDVIDEAYEFEEDNEVIEEKKIENDLIDGEINVSDDSQNYIPTPREDDEDYENNYQDETGNNTKRIYADKENEEAKMDGSEFEFGKDEDAGSSHDLEMNSPANPEKEIEALNLDQETKDLFKYIKVFKVLTSNLIIPI